MTDIKQTPLKIEGISGSLYAGFWRRLGSLFLDAIILAPITFLIIFINSLGKNMYFYTVIPNILFMIFYNIYLPKKYGATPGKLTVGIKIIRTDGEDIDWKEAFLRHSVLLGLTVLSSIMMIVCLLQADDETFKGLSWLQQASYLMSLSPAFFSFYNWTSNLWFYGELIVLLTNKRKRAIHDYMAGTVIVKEKYLPQIRVAMNPVEVIAEVPPNIE